MKDFINRVALVIHWFGFILGASIPTLFLFATIFGNDPDSSGVLLVSPLIFIIFSLGAWVIRYILVGKCHFLPWINNVSK